MEGMHNLLLFWKIYFTEASLMLISECIGKSLYLTFRRKMLPLAYWIHLSWTFLSRGGTNQLKSPKGFMNGDYLWILDACHWAWTWEGETQGVFLCNPSPVSLILWDVPAAVYLHPSWSSPRKQYINSQKTPQNTGHENMHFVVIAQNRKVLNSSG